MKEPHIPPMQLEDQITLDLAKHAADRANEAMMDSIEKAMLAADPKNRASVAFSIALFVVMSLIGQLAGFAMAMLEPNASPQHLANPRTLRRYLRGIFTAIMREMSTFTGAQKP